MVVAASSPQAGHQKLDNGLKKNQKNRIFEIQSVNDFNKKYNIELFNGLIITMGGQFQSNFRHSVLKLSNNDYINNTIGPAGPSSHHVLKLLYRKLNIEQEQLLLHYSQNYEVMKGDFALVRDYVHYLGLYN